MNNELAMRTLAYLITHYKEHDETIINLEEIEAIEFLQQENQELKKQIEEKNPFKGIFAQVNDDTLLRDCGNMHAEIQELHNQQKEFIEYLENEINKWHYNYDNYTYEYELEEPTAEELLQTVLSKYKEIIGGKE